MSTGKRRIFERELKLLAVQRVMSGERGAVVCEELHIRQSLLSKWCANYRRHGPEGVRRVGRPRKGDLKLKPVAKADDLAKARERISELERKIGQQQVELDFFQRALRHVRQARRPSDGHGVMTSTRSSRR